MPLVVSDADTELVLQKVRRAWQFDSMNVPPALWAQYILIDRVAFADLLSRAGQSLEGLRECWAPARCFGKTSPDSLLSEVRAIIPLPFVASALDTILAHRLTAFADRHFLDVAGVFTGGRERAQVADISFSLQLLFE